MPRTIKGLTLEDKQNSVPPTSSESKSLPLRNYDSPTHLSYPKKCHDSLEINISVMATLIQPHLKYAHIWHTPAKIPF